MRVLQAKKVLWFVVLGTLLVAVGYFKLPSISRVSYTRGFELNNEAGSPMKEKKFVATHIKAPEPLKGVYMTSWVAGTPSLRAGVFRLINETEINTVVIDIKDDTGRVSYEVSDPELKAYGSEEIRIKDSRELINSLHSAGIYVVGRVAVFQDPFMVRTHPELAVRKTNGEVWRDRKGLTWIDTGSKEFWKYVVLLARDAYSQGFDEIQFDYVRFPSDGNLNNIQYPFSQNRVKSEVVKEFFEFLSSELRSQSIPISVDLFGLTTTSINDLNIGQIIEDSFLYFDYVSPMVYPSHFASGSFGYKDVNSAPYEIVKLSLESALVRLRTFNDIIASTTVKIRPWLQDNDYPVTYTAEMVRKQIQATYDAGLTSWMLWDPANQYTRPALLPE